MIKYLCTSVVIGAIVGIAVVAYQEYYYHSYPVIYYEEVVLREC